MSGRPTYDPPSPQPQHTFQTPVVQSQSYPTYQQPPQQTQPQQEDQKPTMDPDFEDEFDIPAFLRQGK